MKVGIKAKQKLCDDRRLVYATLLDRAALNTENFRGFLNVLDHRDNHIEQLEVRIEQLEATCCCLERNAAEAETQVDKLEVLLQKVCRLIDNLQMVQDREKKEELVSVGAIRRWWRLWSCSATKTPIEWKGFSGVLQGIEDQ